VLVRSVNCYPKQNNRYNQSFTSRVKKDYPENSATPHVKSLIDVFEENPDIFCKLGSSQCAEVYVLDPLNKLVVKKSLPMMETTNNKFKNEAQILSKIPPTFVNAQQFNTRVKTEQGNYFLVSSLMQGTPISYQKKAINYESLFKIVEALYKLDKNGFYHNDLNLNNLLLDGSGANLIDFQWATTFEPYVNNESTNVYFPGDIIPANSLNFEQTGLASYILKANKYEGAERARDIFRTYVRDKSFYHLKRYMHYRQLAENNKLFKTYYGNRNKYVFNALKYEKALSKVYSLPNDDVIDVELMRTEFLYSQRKSYQFTDPNIRRDVNSLNAYQYMGNAVCALNNFNYHLKELEKNYADDKYMKRYIEYNKKIAHYYADLYTNWFQGTFKYLMALTEGNAKINGTKNLDKNVNHLNDFEPGKTFEPLLSERVSTYNVPLRTLAPSKNRDIYSKSEPLKEAIDNLVAQKQMKHWEAKFYKSYNTSVYEQIKNVEKGIRDSIHYLEINNPVDAITTGLYTKFLLETLYKKINNAEPTMAILNAQQACRETRHALDKYLKKGNNSILNSLNHYDIHRVSSLYDANLSKIYDYNY